MRTFVLYITHFNKQLNVEEYPTIKPKLKTVIDLLVFIKHIKSKYYKKDIVFVMQKGSKIAVPITMSQENSDVSLQLIDNVQHRDSQVWSKDLNKLIQDDLKNILMFVGIYELDAVPLEPNSWYKPIWGRAFWKFLHYTSVMIYPFEDLINEFALLMINFYNVIPCGVCYANYIKHDPLNLVYNKIKQTGDPIYAIYNLHHVVNGTDPRKFSFSDFITALNNDFPG